MGYYERCQHDQSFRAEPRLFPLGYALPAHELYQVLIQIWSDGCENQLYRALPILFSWRIAGAVFVVIAMRHRCHIAVAVEEAAAAAKEKNRNISQTNLSRDSSIQEIIPPDRQDTVEASQTEQAAYGPTYPTPFVRE